MTGYVIQFIFTKRGGDLKKEPCTVKLPLIYRERYEIDGYKDLFMAKCFAQGNTDIDIDGMYTIDETMYPIEADAKTLKRVKKAIHEQPIYHLYEVNDLGLLNENQQICQGDMVAWLKYYKVTF